MLTNRNAVFDKVFSFLTRHITCGACALLSITAGCVSNPEERPAVQTMNETVIHEKTTTTAVVVVDSNKFPQPEVTQNAALREAIRQDTTWTSENIQRYPYLFIQDQIRKCDSLKTKIETQTISLTRMEKEAKRKAEETNGAIAKNTRFLEQANAAYDAAEASGKWPVTINGYEMDEDELGDKMEEAQTRLETARKWNAQNSALAKKIEIRKNVLKRKKHELANLRIKLVQQAEQVKTNAAISEIEGLKDVLGTIGDMIVEIDEEPVKLSLDDVMTEDPAEAKKARIRAIREKSR